MKTFFSPFFVTLSYISFSKIKGEEERKVTFGFQKKNFLKTYQKARPF